MTVRGQNVVNQFFVVLNIKTHKPVLISYFKKFFIFNISISFYLQRTTKFILKMKTMRINFSNFTHFCKNKCFIDMSWV